MAGLKYLDIMDGDKDARIIEGLKAEISMIEAQLNFPRSPAPDLLKSLLQHFQETSSLDIWLNQAAASKSENPFKAKGCCSMS